MPKHLKLKVGGFPPPTTLTQPSSSCSLSSRAPRGGISDPAPKGNKQLGNHRPMMADDPRHFPSCALADLGCHNGGRLDLLDLCAVHVTRIADSSRTSRHSEKYSRQISEVAQLMRPKQKAARRRLLNSNPMIVDQATINAGFDFRR